MIKSMKRIITTILLTSCFCVCACAQDDDKTMFDFWVGKWEVSWEEAEGKIGKGTNNVVRILDNTVIQENFKTEEGSSKGYLGTSISVYNPKRKTWHQGYADNQGAYFSFIGERSGDKRIFKTETVTPAGKPIVQRMVFYNIKPDSMTWDWESSEDGGKTWKLNWRINYKRI
jgi:hypothetical protein